MLHGRFGDTSGAPFLEGLLTIPRLGISVNVSFLVDTGADKSVLMPADAIAAGLDYTHLAGHSQMVGVGGVRDSFEEPAVISFIDETALHMYDVKLAIVPFSDGLLDIPSLLGRDVLNRWRMDYYPAVPRLTFDVIDSDRSVPIPN